jgi:cell division protein FtsB
LIVRFRVRTVSLRQTAARCALHLARRLAVLLLVSAERLQPWRRRLATVAVVVVACLVGAHALLGDNGILVYMEKRAEHRRLVEEIDALKQENERLGGQIRSLRTDPHAIEREARQQLRYARPGEVIYLLPPKPATEPAAEPAPPPTAGRR